MGSKKKGQEPRDGRESPPTPAAGCWMWQREGDDSWNKRWCKCTNKRLTVFASEQESTTLEVWPLQQTKLQEVTFTGWVPEPLRSRQQRGFVLRRRREQPDSPRAVTELPGSIGDLTEQYSDGDMELVLALESTLDHQTWTRHLSKVCTVLTAPDPASRRGTGSFVPGCSLPLPPPLALQGLFAPGLQLALELQEQLATARRTLWAVVRDLSFPRDAALHAQVPMLDVQACLIGVSRHLHEAAGEEGVVAGGAAGDEAGAAEEPPGGRSAELAAVGRWLQAVTTFVVAVAATLEELALRDNGTNVAAALSPLAQDVALQVEDAEDALRWERIWRIRAEREQEQQGKSPSAAARAAAVVAAAAVVQKGAAARDSSASGSASASHASGRSGRSGGSGDVAPSARFILYRSSTPYSYWAWRPSL